LKKVIIILVFVAIAVGGYFGYQKWEETRDVNAWSLITDDVFFVYETDNLWQIYNNVDSIKTWKTLADIPSFAKIKNNLDFLDSLSTASKVSRGSISSLFQNTPALISLHITEAQDFDFLYLLEIKNLEQLSITSAIVDAIARTNRKNTRKYLGKTISEIQSGGKMFSYIFYKNYFIGSFTPFLVEGAIRTITETESQSFIDLHPQLFKLAKLNQDQGNVYINLKKLSRIAEVFSDRVKIDLSALDKLGYESFLDLRVEENNVILNGFSLDQLGAESILSTFVGNPGVPFSLQNVIPNRTAYFYHFSFKNFEAWQTKWSKVWPEEQVSRAQQKASLLSKYDVDLSAAGKWVGSEIGLAALETNSSGTEDYLIAISTPDVGEAYKQLNTITERMATADRDTVYSESYGNYEIREIKIPQLPLLLFGTPFYGFENTYFLPLDGNIILSNSVKALKLLLDDIESEDTWGKSIKMMDYLSSLNKESNLSLIINTNRSWSNFMNKLNANWQPTFEEHANLLRSFETLAVQFSNIDTKYYTNIVLNQQGQPETKKFTQSIVPEKAIELTNTISTKPSIFRNSDNKSLELFVQDANNRLYHLSSDFEVLWSDSLAESINSSIYQLDYFKNGKQQIIFSNSNTIQAFDRTGKTFGKFPLTKPNKDPIQFFNLIDYDKSKNYRFAVADTGGQLWLIDKDGGTLEGWNPKTFESPLASNPFHIRVAAKDLIVAPLINGEVHIFTRRGDYYKGFPLELKDQLSNELHVDLGTSLEKTFFSTITNNGEIIKFNGLGSISTREQLIRTNATTKYQLVVDVLKTGFVISRLDEFRVAILNEKGKVLFEKDYISTGDLRFQYYNFGAGNEVIIILDKEQQYAYLFDKKGDLINSQPISASEELAVMYSESEKEYRIYKVYQKELSLLKLKK
jgi:hypothetical protein